MPPQEPLRSPGKERAPITFRYTVTPDQPCAVDQEEVTVILHPVPVANAGPDGLVDLY
jgi:hypothetical protein